MYAIEAKGLRKTYPGGVEAVKGISFEVEEGEVFGLLGPNGAGKSTLLKALIGLIKPTAGRVRVAERDVTRWPPENLVRAGMSYVPQVANIFHGLTVRENLEMGAFCRSGGVAERVEQMCDLFGDLRPALRRKAGTLSGGQRTMLAMARGLMIDPVVMLLDEPSAGLSPAFQSTLWEQVAAVAGTGVGVCVVEQNTRRTLQHANWAYVLAQGRNRLDGPARQLLHDEEVVNLYVGRLS